MPTGSKAAPRRVGATTLPDDTNPTTDAADEVDKAYGTAQTGVITVTATVLEDLREELSQDTEVEPYDAPIPNRPGWGVRYMPDFDYDQLRFWMKRAKVKGSKKDDDPDMLRLSFSILLHCCVGVLRNGKLLEYQGEPMTFTDERLWDTQNLPLRNAVNSIRKLYGKGSDGHIILTMKKIAEFAGYSDEIDLEMGEQDPLGD